MLKKLLDRLYFKKMLKEDVGLSEIDKQYLKSINDGDRLVEILNRVKTYIAHTSLMSNSVEGIQRRNNWIECITYIQKMCELTKTKNINYLTMKEKK